MTKGPVKSRADSLLVLHLVFVTVWGVFLFWLCGVGRFGNWGVGISLAALLAGYTVAIHRDYPFFFARPSRWSWLISTALALIPLALVISPVAVVVVGFLLQPDYRRAHFVSPTNAADEVWFYDGGVHDRDLFVCVEPEKGWLRMFGRFDDYPDHRFSHAQWTRDGQVFVCWMQIKTVGEKPIMVAAYDFKNVQALMPEGMKKFSPGTRSRNDWLKNAAAVKTLADNHGGLDDRRIDDDVLRKNEKDFRFSPDQEATKLLTNP